MKLTTKHSLAGRLAICAITLLIGQSVNAITASVPTGAALVIPSPNLRTIEISLDNASGVEGLVFRIQYNRSIAAATAVRGTSLVSGCAVEINTTDPVNEVQISMACATPRSGSGPVFEIDFAGVNAGSTDLTFLECVLNEGSPACQVVDGDLLVTTCGLDVDANGSASASTDGVYIFRALPPTLQTIVPQVFRNLFPGIPSDAVISDNIDNILPMLDVDDRNGAQASTDGVYIYRALPPTLDTIVPLAFRNLDPSIPSDAIIGGNVDDICP